MEHNRMRSIGHILVIAIAAAIGSAAAAFILEGTFPATSIAQAPQECNVLGLEIHGMIVQSKSDIPVSDLIQTQDPSGMTTLLHPSYTVANEIEDRIRYSLSDERYKAILVDVQSGGGAEVAGDDIALSIKKFGRPSVAVIHDTGLSSGYLIASAADTVFASEDSYVGSIGATASYLAEYEKNKKEGFTYVQIASGPYKELGTPYKPLTDAERELLLRDVKDSRDSFVRTVAAHRKMPVEKIDALADGSAFRGLEALEKGLIDKIGSSWDATAHLEEVLGEPVVICWS